MEVYVVVAEIVFGGEDPEFYVKGIYDTGEKARSAVKMLAKHYQERYAHLNPLRSTNYGYMQMILFETKHAENRHDYVHVYMEPYKVGQPSPLFVFAS